MFCGSSVPRPSAAGDDLPHVDLERPCHTLRGMETQCDWEHLTMSRALEVRTGRQL
jgi:hypothetical protein